MSGQLVMLVGSGGVGRWTPLLLQLAGEMGSECGSACRCVVLLHAHLRMRLPA